MTNPTALPVKLELLKGGKKTRAEWIAIEAQFDEGLRKDGLDPDKVRRVLAGFVQKIYAENEKILVDPSASEEEKHKARQLVGVKPKPFLVSSPVN